MGKCQSEMQQLKHDTCSLQEYYIFYFWKMPILSFKYYVTQSKISMKPKVKLWNNETKGKQKPTTLSMDQVWWPFQIKKCGFTYTDCQ